MTDVDLNTIQVLSIRYGTFKWLGKTAESTLQDIDLTVRKGDLVGVMGRVGAGKVCILKRVALPHKANA